MISKKNSSKSLEEIEIRCDQFTKSRVIINANRGSRPEEFDQSKKRRASVSKKETCPFCRGNEQKYAPRSHYIVPKDGEWKVRVIPNKFPILSSAASDSHAVLGDHEVIITHDHEKQVADMKYALIEELLGVYQQRLRFHAKNKEYVLLFQNEGDEAGASITHPHSQLIAFSKMPEEKKAHFENAASFYKSNNRDLFSERITNARTDNRVIYEDQSYIVLSPFAAQHPFEVNIYPLSENPYFEKEEKDNLEGLAKIIKKTLQVINARLGKPAYNLYIETLPPHLKKYEKSMRWFIRVIPRLSINGGLELATNISVNSMLPENAASFLRFTSFNSVNE